jgi:hypothetical protein
VISGAFGCGNSWGLLVVVTCRIGKWDHGTHGTWRNPVDIRKTMENHHFLMGKSTIFVPFSIAKNDQRLIPWDSNPERIGITYDSEDLPNISYNYD